MLQSGIRSPKINSTREPRKENSCERAAWRIQPKAGRLSLPAEFRKVLSENLRVTPDPTDQCLLVFETEAFSAWVESLFEAQGGYSASNRKMVAQRKVLNSRAKPCEVDNSGRIHLSPQQRDSASLDKDVVIVGDTDHFEIWDEERWNQFVEDTDVASLVS